MLLLIVLTVLLSPHDSSLENGLINSRVFNQISKVFAQL